MSIRVRIGAGESHLEHQQIKARLEALGLELKPDNTIDEASAKSVSGGLAALQALAKDGVLDADAIATLRRQTHMLGSLVGKDLPISQKESNAWKALAMDLTGTASTLSSIESTVRSTGTIDNSLFHRAGARLEQLTTNMDKLSALSPDLQRLARTSPEALRDVAAAGKDLTAAATRFQSTLSLFRSAMLEELSKAHGPEYRVIPQDGGFDVQKRPGLWSRMQTDALAGSLSNALDALPVYAQLGQALSLPIGSPSLYGSAPAADAVRSKPSPGRTAGAAQTILNGMGSDPGLFPGSVGPQTAERFGPEVRGAFRAVLDAAATDMVSRREISNSYGNSYTGGDPHTLQDTAQAVPRPIFKAALNKAQQILDRTLDALPAAQRDASHVRAKASELAPAGEPHYAAAAAALFEASGKTGVVRAGYGVNSVG
jgi:hypothetical protein